MKAKIIMRYIILFFLSIGTQGQTKISGKVTDGLQFLAGVNVVVLNEDSGYVAGTVTDAMGIYTIENVKEGNYKLLFTSIGYTKRLIDTKLNSEDLHISDVAMEIEAFEMNAVTVKAKRPAFKIEPGKTTVDLVAASLGSDGSLLSTLSKIPGILILNDGTVLLNGQAGANVMIDGKLTYLSGENLLNLLRSMPSSAVDKIEMVTQPSAQYDAAGAGGFINIKRKLKTDEGLNFNLSSNVEAGERFRQNQSAALQLQKKKYSFYANYSFYKGEDFILINSSRDYLQTKTTEIDAARLDMKADRKFGSHSNYFKTGIEYEFSEKLSVSADVYSNWFRRKKTEMALSDFYGTSPSDDFSLDTENDQHSNHKNRGGGMSTLYKFRPELKWENTVNFLVFEQNEKLDQKSKMNSFSQPESNDALQGNMRGDIQIFSFQSNVDYNLTDNFKVNTGIKVSTISIDNDAVYNSLQPNGWIRDEKLSSTFLYKEKVPAVYLQTGQKWSERFSTEAGFRVEFTDTEARYVSGSLDSTLVRNYGQFFPSFAANYKITNNHTVSFQYGRRIVRPNYRDLNPFTEVNDRYLQERGNTALKPELVNNIEVSLRAKSRFVFSAFYIARKNPITKSYLTETDNEVTIVMPLNLKDSYALGFRAGLNTIKPFSWWTMHLNGSLTYKAFDWQEVGVLYTNKFFTPTFQISNQLMLPRDWAIEATGYYNGTSAEGQARIGAIGSASVGARKSFFQDRLSLYVYVNDIFLSNLQNITLYNSVIEGAYKERRDTRAVGITLLWRLNSGSFSKVVRKTENMEESRRINL